MASVKKVIEKHNGTIRIAFSEKGKGTCIEILIP
jgi:signal transduction histidine kinase